MLNITSKIKVVRINGSVQRGGWEATLVGLSDSDVLTTNQRAVCNWRGGFGGAPGAERTAFDGYVLPTRIDFDIMGSQTQFTAQTSDGFLRKGWLQGIGFADTGVDPRDHYHQFDSVTGAPVERMTMGRIVRHILGYYDELGAPPATNPDWVAHTNMVHHPTQNPHGWITLNSVETEPFDAVGNPDGTMRVDRYIVRETSNLWDRLTEIARNEFFVIYFDKDDNLYYTKHPMYRTVIPDPVMTFDENFVITPVSVEVRSSSRVRQVKLHAVTDEGATMHSNYPVSPTHVYGTVDEITKIRCNDQATLDSWARRKYYWENRDYTVTWTAPGLCGLLFELMDRIQITYSGTDANGVHIEWEEAKFWIDEINVIPDDYGSGISVFTLEAESPCLDSDYFC